MQEIALGIQAEHQPEAWVVPMRFLSATEHGDGAWVAKNRKDVFPGHADPRGHVHERCWGRE